MTATVAATEETDEIVPLLLRCVPSIVFRLFLWSRHPPLSPPCPLGACTACSCRACATFSRRCAFSVATSRPKSASLP